MWTLKKYTLSTAMSCSTSLKEIMPPETLVDLLSGKQPLDKQWVHHITVLFSEIPPVYLAHTLAENDLSYEDAEKLYACLPPVLQYRPIQEVSINE